MAPWDITPFFPLAWFANPLMLWGLGAASIPILIHLLNRRKFREEPWAAMRFLLAAIKRNQRRIRIEQWLLLAVRTALLALLALAMAKPVLEGAGVSILPGQRTHWVLVLDGSMSMNLRQGDGTRFEQAKAIASRLVQDARQGDPLSVLLMANPPRAVIAAPSFAKDAVRAELDALQPTDGTVDLPATFQKIEEILAASEIPRKEVVFLTDLQAASWRKPDSAPTQDALLKRIFAGFEARKVRSQLIDLGAAGADNHAIIDLALSPAVPTVNSPASVRATLRNFGARPIENLPVRLALGNRIVEESAIRLAPGEEQSIAFNLQFPSAGEISLSVSTQEDALSRDDSRRLAIPVREAIPVLLVDGDPQPDLFRSETDFLAEALDPGESSSGEPRPFRVEKITDSQLARRDLADFDVVFLCNVARLTDLEVANLEAFLKQGGGVVVFGGDQVDVDNANRLLHNNGQGFLPARIGPAQGDPAAPASAVLFDPAGFSHPLIAPFAGQSPGVQASLTAVKTQRYHRLELPRDTQAKVALAFSNGLPAIVEASRGQGHVFQIATTADQSWTTWPLHPSFVPVMEQLVALAASGRLGERNVSVGQPLLQLLPAAASGTEVAIQKPGNAQASLRLTPQADSSLLRFDETDHVGLYSAELGPPLSRKLAFAVNPDPVESDLSHLDQASLKATLPGWNFHYDSDWKPYQQSAASVAQRGEQHRPLLWAVLVLLLVESLLAFVFGHHAQNATSWRNELLFLVIRVLPIVLLAIVAAALLLAPAASAWLPALLLHLLPPGTVAPPAAGEALVPQLRFESPWSQLALALTIIACVLLIVGIYRRESSAPRGARALLSAMRIGLVLLAIFFLAEAVLQVERTGLPYFVVMVDDSASSTIVDRFEDAKTQARLNEFAKSAGRTEEPDRITVARGWLATGDGQPWKELQSQHRLKLYAVSNQARPLLEVADSKQLTEIPEALKQVEARGEQSRLGDAVRQVLTELRGSAPSAILLLTDGQTTEGESLPRAAELARQKGVPLFTLGLGDPAPPRDLELSDLQVDEVVFVEDAVRFQARVTARGFSGQKLPVVLRRRPPGTLESDPGEEIARTTIDAPPDGQSTPVELVDRPRQTGPTTYILEVGPQPRELRTENNRITREILVREDKLKVLLVDTEPRYEFRYLKNYLEREKTIKLDVLLLASDPEYAEQDPSALGVLPQARDGEGGLFEYDVVILGDADPSVLSESQMQGLVDFVVKKGGGLLFIAGQNFNPLTYSRKPLETLLPIQLAEARDPIAVAGNVAAFRPALTAEGRSHPIFRLGEDEASSLEIWNSLQPLFWYLEAPRKKPTAFVLAEHPERSGPEGNFPLILYQYVGSGKVSFHAFDDTWRWRFRTGDRYFGRFWTQTIRFLARNRMLGQKQAEVLTDRRRYTRNQPILLQVRFLNAGLAPADQVSIQIERKGTAPRKLDLRRSQANRGLFEGSLPQSPEGDYQVRLLPPPVLPGPLPSTSFRVDPPAGELENIRMNEPELRKAAALSGGQFLTPEATSFADLLKTLPPPRKVPLETDPPIPLWNAWPMLLLFIALITAEWLFRKRKQLV
jgi:Mg-chelatase subunit ChlD